MNINEEEEKEDYSLLDDKKKEQIILELQNEIKKQKELYLNKEQNILDYNNNENKLSIELNQSKVNNDISSKILNEKENINYSKNNDKNETNLIFEDINNFILKNDQKK